MTRTVGLGETFFGPSAGEPWFAVGQVDPAAFVFNLISQGVGFLTVQQQLEAAEEAADAAEAAARAVVEAERIRAETERARIAADKAAQERALSVDLIPGVPNVVLGVTGAGLLTLGALKFFGVI